MTQSGVTRWTNPSVLRFAGEDDPIEKIEERVREIVLRARDAGWTGPPFNPLALAAFLEIAVDPTTAVVDARTVSSPSGVRIQYNPQQARERARFSIAHEIAHTFFDDVADATRHRGGDPAVSDDWQLEMLCNLAAAEIVMPVGSLPARVEVPLLETLLKERLSYDVSIEAFLIRVIKAARTPVSMLVASPRLRRSTIQYRIDYAVSSPGALPLAIRNKTVPVDSAILHCTAIGATSHGTEEWLSDQPVKIEAVGVPGYPGSSYPRVAALIRHAEASAADAVHFVQGNVLSPRPFPPQIICQVTNDKALRWGGGLAKQTAKRYPVAEQEYGDWIKEVPKAQRLGDVHFARVSEGCTIASMIAQEGYGASASPRIRYWALDRCLEQVGKVAKSSNASVHMPHIGTGGAQAEWPLVEAMIRAHLHDLEKGVWVYQLPPRQEQPSLGL